jgi:hypothetical protein
LTPEAAEVWRRTIALRPDADADALCVYANAVAEYGRVQSLLDRSGPLIQGAKGLVRNPLQQVKAANAQVVRQLGRDLGLLGPADVSAPPRRYRNQRSAEATISALRQLGHLEPVDEATLALVRTVASALDMIEATEAPAALASLARVQLAAITMLRSYADDSTDTLAALLASMSGEMGDAPEA